MARGAPTPHKSTRASVNPRYRDVRRRNVPRLALTRAEAAEALGVGLTTFKTRIAPELPVVREGKVRLYPVRDLERWLEQNAERPIAEQVSILRVRGGVGG